MLLGILFFLNPFFSRISGMSGTGWKLNISSSDKEKVSSVT